MTQHFPVLVVGAGPAGIAAAVSAAEAGSHVALLDDNPEPGGQIWRAERNQPGPAAHGSLSAHWRARLLRSSITRLQGWSVFDQPEPMTLRAERDGSATTFSADRIILATGARERFLPFPGWTLPNVMGVGGLQAMVKAGLPIRGKRVVLAGSGPLLLAVAHTLHAAGANIILIAEQAQFARIASFAASLIGSPSKLLEGISYRASTIGVPYHTSSWPLEARGIDRVTSAVLSIHGRAQEIACDYLACGFHLVPNLELPALLGCRIESGTVVVGDLQHTSVPGVLCAGEPTGIAGLESSLLEGEIAGLAAAGRTVEATRLVPGKNSTYRFARRMARAFSLRPELKTLPKRDTIVCRCEDVPMDALRHHPTWRAAKLHTRCGMGPCQGRICGTATSFLLDWNPGSVRPPILPALVSSLTTTEDPD